MPGADTKALAEQLGAKPPAAIGSKLDQKAVDALTEMVAAERQLRQEEYERSVVKSVSAIPWPARKVVEKALGA